MTERSFDRDSWIVVPNWERYQAYKKRDPIWLRDYVRQLWSRQWSELTLPQRGLLWTARLAFAHHDGQLRYEELLTYLRTMERANVRTIADRLNHAGLLDVVASTPLSLSLEVQNRKNLKPNRDDALAREAEPPAPKLVVVSDKPAGNGGKPDVLERLVRNVGWQYTDASLRAELVEKGADPETVERLLGLAAELRGAEA